MATNPKFDQVENMTSDIGNALTNANSPNTGNPFATMNDVGGGGSGIVGSLFVWDVVISNLSPPTYLNLLSNGSVSPYPIAHPPSATRLQILFNASTAFGGVASIDQAVIIEADLGATPFFVFKEFGSTNTGAAGGGTPIVPAAGGYIGGLAGGGNILPMAGWAVVGQVADGTWLRWNMEVYITTTQILGIRVVQFTGVSEVLVGSAKITYYG